MVANEAVARAWMEYVKTGTVSDKTPPPVPCDVSASIRGDEGTEITWKADADFESGIRNFIVLRDGQELAQVPEKPVGKFGRPLFQSMTYHDTPSQPMPEMRYLDASAKSGEKHSYSVIAVNSVELKSEPSASTESRVPPPFRPPNNRGATWFSGIASRVTSGSTRHRWETASWLRWFLAACRGTHRADDSSFWSGCPHDYNDTNALKYFPQIRDLGFRRKIPGSRENGRRHIWGIPKAQQAYQPIGDLLLSFDGVDATTDYRRELDMETGVAKVNLRVGDTVFTREVFISYPDRMMVVRLTANKPGSIRCRRGSRVLTWMESKPNPASL